MKVSSNRREYAWHAVSLANDLNYNAPIIRVFDRAQDATLSNGLTIHVLDFDRDGMGDSLGSAHDTLHFFDRSIRSRNGPRHFSCMLNL